jgi:DNA adenine methylase
MKPVVKWVGGKAQLLDRIKELLPDEFGTYYEPFVGGAAVLLDLNPTNAVVNDINSELINMYRMIKDQVEDVIQCLLHLDSEHEVSPDPAAYYYKVRDDFNWNLGMKRPPQAARFIYLNKHCFNGLYRVNKKGEFNVPFNHKKTGNSFDPDHLRKLSSRLKDVSILNTDFEDTVKNAGKDDLVFLDSPYDLITATSFTDYTKEGFGYADHCRLARLFRELDNRGCYCILTNHDTPLIRELYKDYYFTEVDVRRSINRNGSDRTGKEVIITNYNTEGTDFKPMVIEPHDEGDVV